MAEGTLARMAATLELRDFRHGYSEHMHREWQSHYVDADAVIAALHAGVESGAAIDERDAGKIPRTVRS